MDIKCFHSERLLLVFHQEVLIRLSPNSVDHCGIHRLRPGLQKCKYTLLAISQMTASGPRC